MENTEGLKYWELKGIVSGMVSDGITYLLDTSEDMVEKVWDELCEDDENFEKEMEIYQNFVNNKIINFL